MSTPGRRRALKALAAAKERNLHAIAKGEAPKVAGKKVKPGTGNLPTKTQAKSILKNRKSS